MSSPNPHYAAPYAPDPRSHDPGASIAGLPPASLRRARFWDRIARSYAADPIADLPGYEATLRRIGELLKPHDEVLEIGCGTGTSALRLAPLVRHMLATDVSAGMIAIACEKLAALPVSPLRFEVADAEASTFGEHSFDVVLALNLLHLAEDLDRMLAQGVRALRPGGLLISKTPCVAEMNPLVTWIALPLMRAAGKAPRVHCFAESGLRQAMSRQGLVVDKVERHGTRGKDFRVFIVARKPA